MSPVKPSKALSNLPPYLFVHLLELKRQAKELGRDIIDLGMGNPDIPTPPHIVEALAQAVRDPSTHRYPIGRGTPEFLSAAAAYYKKRFNAVVDPSTEAVALVGSKEGIGHTFMALADPGDTVIVPTPAYPAHVNAPYISRTKPYWAVLSEDNGYLMDFGKIPASVLRKARLMVLNYPNNPTGAVVENKSYLKDALKLAAKYGFLILYDNPYSDICFDGYRAPSILELSGAKKYAVEFNSLSKTYSMAGWRIGYALGNAQAIGYLAKFKGFIDYGVPTFIQRAAIAALENGGEEETAKIYERRRNAFLRAARENAGWDIPKVKASMYLWTKIPAWSKTKKSFDFVKNLLLQTGVCLSPGTGFGQAGEGYVRISLVESEERLAEAARRISSLKTLRNKETAASAV
ncbi:MAG: aminotransferase class I/II-fold pyridoxal phosphate-dependent enzyme [Elusimicrobia bacterium]|nr:aminotransferase class I/II-fold pyridoxal phosphate-dependent enzyme [Elusimicrobiota bacterium]